MSTTALATSPQAMRTAQRWLKDYQGAITRRLPGGMDGERYTALVMSEMQRTPRLLECLKTPRGTSSLMTAVLAMSQVGLEPGPLGEAYLLPFENRRGGFMSCVFLIGYRGMIQLAYRSKELQEVEAVPVYADDEFTWRRGLHKDIVHEPVYEGEPDFDRMTHVYAIARTTRGGVLFVVLSKAQVIYYRNRSRAKDDGPWVTDPVPMSCKTAVRRLAPVLPLRPNDAAAIAADEARDEGRELPVDVELHDGDEPGPGGTVRRRALRDTTEPEVDPDEVDRALRAQDAARAAGEER